MSTSDALPQLNNTTLDKGLKETQQALVKIANRLVTMAESQKELSSITAETARSMVAQKNRVADLEAKVHRLETNTVYSQGFYQGEHLSIDVCCDYSRLMQSNSFLFYACTRHYNFS